MTVILEERPESGVVVLRLNRPDVLNALNMEVRRALADRFTALADEPDVRAVVLAGSQKAFAAGADIAEMKDLGVIDQYQRHAERLWQAIARYPRPVIAAVRGFALGGGCELAMHADIIVAGAGAQFGQPEIRVGIMPGAGGTQRLLRAVGKYKAMKMLLTGKPVSADEALSMGLISDVVDDEEVENSAIAMARTIAGMPPIAVEQIKEVVLAGQDAPLDAALALERKAMQMLFASRDQEEGMAAFLEKRRPTYTGQ